MMRIKLMCKPNFKNSNIRQFISFRKRIYSFYCKIHNTQIALYNLLSSSANIQWSSPHKNNMHALPTRTIYTLRWFCFSEQEYIHFLIWLSHYIFTPRHVLPCEFQTSLQFVAAPFHSMWLQILLSTPFFFHICLYALLII